MRSIMSGQKIKNPQITTNRCSFCGRQVGKGKGKLTAAEINNAKVDLQDWKLPQLKGFRANATVGVCIDCATKLADTLNKLQADVIMKQSRISH